MELLAEIAMGRLKWLCVAGILLLCLGAAPSPAQPQPLTNDSVIKMTKAGLPESIIIQSINGAPGNFSTTPGDLANLKQARVSERVIKAMMAKNGSPMEREIAPPGPASPGAAPIVRTAASTFDASLAVLRDPGVYYKDHSGKWILMGTEPVSFRAGGLLKSYATEGVIKQDSNGHVFGPTADLALTKPATFLIYLPDGGSPVDFLLLKLRATGKSREFRSVTGGVMHSTPSTERNEIAFTTTRVAPYMYTFDLPASAGIGEYGILPPGLLGNENASTTGNMFTFKIVE